MVLFLALTGYLTFPAAGILWGTTYFCFPLLFLAGLAPPYLVFQGSLSRIIRVEPLRFCIPHFYCFVLSWGRASFLVWHFACCQHNTVRSGFRVWGLPPWESVAFSPALPPHILLNFLSFLGEASACKVFTKRWVAHLMWFLGLLFFWSIVVSCVVACLPLAPEVLGFANLRSFDKFHILTPHRF